MKDYLLELARSAVSPAEGRNRVREYIQARILGVLQRAGAMIPLAFQGGTALRLIFGIPRYSEDLDFTLERAREQYDFRRYLRAVQSELGKEGYVVALKVSDKKTVHGAFVHFPGLLHDLALSPHVDESLSVKIEVDTSPPAGAQLTTTIVRRHVTLRLQHHDRASLLAGKLHAVLQRSYAKGRDLYDLMWYLSDPDWPAPNLALLNNALRQTGWQGATLTAATWRSAIAERLRQLSWRRVAADVAPFLARSDDATMLTLDNLLGLLEGRQT